MSEESCAKVALGVVERAGGSITFADYDAAMAKEFYFPPMHWLSGWGLSRSAKRSNDDKMCAFAACKAGVLRQTDVGYEVVP